VIRHTPYLITVTILITVGSVSISAQPETVAELRAKAEQGDAEAQYEFGCMNDIGCLDETVLNNGLDLEIDALGDAEAARWYRLAAEQGQAAAQSRLGDFYQFGYGVPRDYAEAVRWHRAAAEQGGAVAQFNLGVRYARGHGVPQNDVETVRWYRLAAEQGYAVAQYNLGLMYAIGRGVPQDDGEAVRWYRLAAEQGHADAQCDLGLMYEVGVGVSQDYVAAHVWLTLSTSQRNSADSNLIVHARDRVAGKMNPDQIAEAQRLARRWDATHPREP